MSVPLLFLTIALLTVGSKAFSKICSDSVSGKSVASYSIFLVVNSLVACIYFAISGGFKLSINGKTLVFSLVYALLVAISLSTNIVALKFTSISNVTIISSVCAMICTVIMGALLFSEKIGIMTVIRLTVMIFALVLAFAEQRRRLPSGEDKKKKKKNGIIPLLLIAASMTLCNTANTVIMKLFAASDGVTGENSFFFYTNVALLIGAAILFSAVCIKDKSELKLSLSLLRPKKLVFVSGNTVLNCLSTVITVWIVAKIDVSVFSPINSAIGIVAGVVGSLIFKEKQGLFAYLAAAVSCIAMII